MSEDKQTVAEETEPEAKPAVEESSAQDDGDDLDSLLNQFDEGTKEEAKSTPEPAADNETLTRLTQLEKQLADQQFQNDMTTVVGKVRGDMDPELFDDTFVEAWVDAAARKQPKLQKAWESRHKDPSGFNKVVSALGRDFNKKFQSMPDKAATEDREAVTQAVRGASNKAPDSGGAPDFSSMSDAEAREAMQKMGIQNPGF